MNFDEGFSDDIFCENQDLDDRPSYRNSRYSNAYGDYMGGYGPPGPPSLLDPLPPFGPPGPLRSPGPSRNRRKPPPPTIWGRGFRSDGPPVPPPMLRRDKDDRAIRYLMRCGVPQQYLNKLPREVLELIEPQYCGLCGLNFDSFSISRVHYLSKNHLKNQKKWITQTLEMGFPSHEAPLRARELYCELCDVQITSKVHADSHYAGKSHRSIVESRKLPKNPVLLQPGMERRVQQLIRREKRCLGKTLPDQKNEEIPPADTKIIKITSPDLYCEICKTCVTCTEQMTAHLNGKKHLTKEKQYILKTMKGDVPDKDKGNTNEVKVKIENNEDTTENNSDTDSAPWKEPW